MPLSQVGRGVFPAAASTQPRDAVAASADDQVVQHRGWFIFLSILLIVAGAAAIAFPILSTFAVELWAAIAFTIAGLAQTIHAFASRSWGGFFWGLLVRLLYLAARVVLWLNPIAGAVTLTAFLAAVLVVDGVFRSILAFQIRPRAGWFWLLLGCIDRHRRLLGWGDRPILKLRMICLDHASNAIDLVTAAVNAAFGLIEHSVFMEDFIDCCASTHRIARSRKVDKVEDIFPLP